MNAGFRESDVEDAALDWLERAGWTKVYGETIVPDSASPERTEFTQTILEIRLRAAMTRLHPGLPASAFKTRSVAYSTPPVRTLSPAIAPRIGT